MCLCHVVQAYFCQPCLSAVCQGPLKKYPAITGQQMAESRYMVRTLMHLSGSSQAFLQQLYSVLASLHSPA